MKRSLSHVGGETLVGGSESESKALAHALDVLRAPAPKPAEAGSTEDADRVHVHGFHAYPARMHPQTAERFVAMASKTGETILDPFCGSGTVLACALLSGRRAIGCDLNPLAVLLAKRKTMAREERDIAAIVTEAAKVRAHADARRKARAGATHRFPAEDVASFQPHVLLELDGLRDGIERAPKFVKDDLLLVLSALLVKVSNKESDTSDRSSTRRLAAGYTAKLYFRKAEELANRLTEFHSAVQEKRGAIVTVDDARELRTVGASSVDAIVTSPPYAGTYDYVAHHALRMRWLGLSSDRLARGEMGSRRELGRLDAKSAESKTFDDARSFLRAAHRVLRSRRCAIILVADSEARGHALRADRIWNDAARDAGFVGVANASQPRQHFHDARAFRDDRPRLEHALLFERR